MSARRPIFRAACLAALLALGIQVAYAVVISWCGSVVSQLFPSDQPYEQLGFLPDGTPVIVTYSPTDYRSRTGRTLDGKVLTRDELESFGSTEGLPGTRPPRSVRYGWPARIQPFNDGREPATYWYFIHTEEKDGHGYFVGYDSKVKLRVGYLGTSGARPDQPPPDECFRVDGRKMMSRGGHLACPVRYYYYTARQPDYFYPNPRWEPMRNWMVYLVSQGQVLEIDLQKQSVRTVIEADGIVSIGMSRRCRPIPEVDERVAAPRRSTYLAVRLQDRVLVVDPHGTERRTYPVPQDVGEAPFEFIERHDATAIVKMNRRRRQSRTPVDLYWIAESKGSVRSETVHLATRGGIEDPRITSALGALVSPVPAVWAIAATIVGPVQSLRAGEASNYAGALATSLSEFWPGLAISFLLAAVGTGLCLRRQRQYAAPWSRTWAVFVFVLGIPGLLGYLFQQRWPVRKECPACGEPAPRDREACPVCTADFPQPAPKGIEVFA